jgi:hypothetical protein
MRSRTLRTGVCVVGSLVVGFTFIQAQQPVQPAPGRGVTQPAAQEPQPETGRAGQPGARGQQPPAPAGRGGQAAAGRGAQPSAPPPLPGGLPPRHRQKRIC